MDEKMPEDNMDIDNSKHISDDILVALRIQMEEFGLAENEINQFLMNYQDDIINNQGRIMEKNEIKEDNNDTGTDNDEMIAKTLNENNTIVQEILDKLIIDNINMKARNNSKKSMQYIFEETQKQYNERKLDRSLSFKLFKSKLSNDECLPIQLLIKDFYIEFTNNTQKRIFQNPDVQSQYLRDFIPELLTRIFENPLFKDETEKEKENTILNTELTITVKLFDITFGPPDDKKRDELLSHKIYLHSWIEPKHFDLPNFNDIIFKEATEELLKINDFQFYYDKIICLDNFVKLIIKAYKENISKTEPFTGWHLITLPIYIILKSNPKNLISNINYIKRYANPGLLKDGNVDCIMTHMWGAITFIETISHTSLSIETEEYYENIKRKENENENNGGFLKIIKNFFVSNGMPSSSQSRYQYPGNQILEYPISNNINRNQSLESSRSIILNKQTNPFESNFTEEEEKELMDIDNYLKRVLSINSNIGRSRSEK